MRNKLMAHCDTPLYGFSTTGLSFFAVFGPWGWRDRNYCFVMEKDLGTTAQRSPSPCSLAMYTRPP